ncbi:diguanylate cyclase domain-containing protein [Marinobacter sp. DUT-1]|uniref:diguanylate cyclase domain-containing protein n=1 Tax=Marinobacter sp. DUT-1 TaxID=3412037 RepID=UPI003D1624E0
MRKCLIGCLALVTLSLSFSGTVIAQGVQELRFGVYAYRPEAIIQERYQPLTDYLSGRIGVPVKLEVLDHERMRSALVSNQLDFFLTNPSQFLIIRSERSLSGVLATLVRREGEVATASLGGVIFTTAGQDDITSLADVQDRTIASPGRHFLGGFQAQALELREAGVDVFRDNRIKLVRSHDRVIRSVLRGDAEIGFVRTGILEELAEDDPSLLDRIKILNRQNLVGFPYVVSTRLYPEWPVVALPHVDSNIVRRVASALFAIEEDYPAALSAGIAGFAPPADYQPVEYLARELRVEPYDQIPSLTWPELVRQYWGWLAAIAILVLLLTGSMFWLGRKRRQLAAEQQRLRRLILSWPQPMLMLRDGTYVDSNRAALELLGFAVPQSILGKDIAAFSPRMQPDGEVSRQKMQKLLSRVRRNEVVQVEWAFRRSDGSQIWVDMTLAPVHEKGDIQPYVLCSWYDVTDRKEAEQRLRLAASVFDHAREAIFITDLHGSVIDVNDAYVEITGRTRTSTIGGLPPLPLEEGAGVFSSARRNGFWSGEFVSKRHNGERFNMALTISGVRNEQGAISHFMGIFSDITQLKAHEKELRTMAHYDALTHLPNRVLFADRMSQFMAQARRQGDSLAVVYIDLDQFKPVNDAFGHKAGDELLIEVAARMRAELREEDTLARIGGDEFAALVVNIEEPAVLTSLLARLLRAVSVPVLVAGHRVQVSASIGYALYPQAQELDGDQLLRQADQAMYEAKKQGRNRYCGFDAGS